MGKRICAQNPLKHGLCSNLLILPTENVDDFVALNRRFRTMLAPRNSLERYQVRLMAEAEWLLSRVRHYERAAMTAEMVAPHPPAETDDNIRTPSHRAMQSAAAFETIHGAGRSGLTTDAARMRYLREFKKAQTAFFNLRDKNAVKTNSSRQTRRTA